MKILAISVLLLLGLAPHLAAARNVVVIDLADSIQPASQRYLERGLEEADETGAALVVIEIDTPGGLLTSTRAMTAAILRSRTPVAVYVTPSGSRAASAGFFLLLSADIAAMAPGTNTGAAQPVAIGQKSDDEDASLAKAIKDAAAFARSLAAQRGRPTKWAARAVEESRSYSADEAREYGLIDTIATSRAGLLRELDGKTVKRADGASHTLELTDAEVVELPRTFAERVLAVIADPQVAYLLLMLGALGLLIELTSPGLMVPGVLGALSLLVSLYGFSMLPVNLVGALLLIAGLGLVIAEAFVTSYGLLAIGGVVTFAIGSLMLVEGPIPDLRIGLETVAPAVIVIGALALLLVTRAVRTRRLRPRTGLDAMRGEVGEVVSAIEPGRTGTVFVHGEYWSAVAAGALPVGTKVRIEDIKDRGLRVTPLRPGEGEL